MKTIKIKLNDLTNKKKNLIFQYIIEFNKLSNYFSDLLWGIKDELNIKEKEKRNYIRNNYITDDIKSKYHSHFIQEALVRVVSLIKNKNIITKPYFNSNDLNITQFLGDIKTYKSNLTDFWFHLTIKFDGFNKRIKIPMPKYFNISNYHKTYKLEKINNDIYLILYIDTILNKLKKNNSSNDVIGIDIGYHDLIALSKGKLYGNNFRDIISNYSEKLNIKQIARNKLWQIAEKNKRKNPNKYLNIKRNNLRTKKQISNKIKNKAIIKTFINNSFNVMFKENDMLILVNENLHFKRKGFYGNGEKTKKTNRKLSFWVNGQIKRTIINKTIENGVFLCSVNARHTSQECSQCGYIDKYNRNGKKFKCKKCGFGYDSDLNAAIVIEKRLSTDQPRLQKLAKNIVKYWRTNQSESELLNKLKFV